MNQTKACPVCGVMANIYVSGGKDSAFYECPTCGRYEFTIGGFSLHEDNRLAPFLFYNAFHDDLRSEYRYHTTLDKETCDRYNKEFANGNNTNGRPVHMDADTLEAWYPKTFAERVDRILLYLAEHIPHIGKEILLSSPEMLSLLFVDRNDAIEKPGYHGNGNAKLRSDNEFFHESQYMLGYLKEVGYITYITPMNLSAGVSLRLMPKGYARVDELQKRSSSGRGALVAMKFGDDTRALREAIRKGIEDAKYHAVFDDESEHNDYITPELLKHIRDSKFVVVDLTHQNNGAYFEEGYAMGLGKPVIQLCKKDTKLHFDIAQKNTIVWETEDDIPLRLKNRILATID